MRWPSRVAVWAVVIALVATACGRNPVIGKWEVDRDDNTRAALIAVDASEMATLRFSSDRISIPGVEIPVTYVVEGDVVRAVRGDGRGEHRVEVLADGRIRVDLPIGVTAIYRRSS